MQIINIEGYQFESDYPLNSTRFNEVACVYVISTGQRWLDVGETDRLGTRLSSHMCRFIKKQTYRQDYQSNLF